LSRCTVLRKILRDRSVSPIICESPHPTTAFPKPDLSRNVSAGMKLTVAIAAAVKASSGTRSSVGKGYRCDLVKRRIDKYRNSDGYVFGRGGLRAKYNLQKAIMSIQKLRGMRGGYMSSNNNLDLCWSKGSLSMRRMRRINK
jgi:hypothetical protein